jgi:hypothetical protein
MPQLILARYLVNDQILEGSAVYDTTGVASIILGYAPSAYNVEVERVVVDAGLGAADFTLFATFESTGGVYVRERALFTADTILVFDESSHIRFRNSEKIIAELTGGTAGDTATVYLQAWAVLYNPETLREEVGPGVVVTAGLHDIGDVPAPDPDGWN